jgi:predicted nucleic acid-binding protein
MAMNRREEEMDEQLEVFNKRANQQLLGFVDARSFFLPIGQSAKHGHG